VRSLDDQIKEELNTYYHLRLESIGGSQAVDAKAERKKAIFQSERKLHDLRLKREREAEATRVHVPRRLQRDDGAVGVALGQGTEGERDRENPCGGGEWAGDVPLLVLPLDGEDESGGLHIE
jgi:hypothetical protein